MEQEREQEWGSAQRSCYKIGLKLCSWKEWKLMFLFLCLLLRLNVPSKAPLTKWQGMIRNLFFGSNPNEQTHFIFWNLFKSLARSIWNGTERLISKIKSIIITPWVSRLKGLHLSGGPSKRRWLFTAAAALTSWGNSLSIWPALSSWSRSLCKPAIPVVPENQGDSSIGWKGKDRVPSL